MEKSIRKVTVICLVLLLCCLSACGSRVQADTSSEEASVTPTGGDCDSVASRQNYLYYQGVLYTRAREGEGVTKWDDQAGLVYLGEMTKIEEDKALLDEDFEGYQMQPGEVYGVTGKRTLYIKRDNGYYRCRPVDPNDPQGLNYLYWDTDES